jgi:hypothetical protein
VDHFLLRRGNLAELAAGGDDELEFVGGVDRASTAGVPRAEESQDEAAGTAHEKKQRASDGEERFHRSSHGKRDLLGALEGESLGNKFAEEDVQVGNQAKSDDDGNTVGIDGGVRDLLDKAKRPYQLGNHGLADPAQGEADHGDAQLDAVDDFIEMLMEALHDAGADAARFDELLNSGVANADQGELRCREKRICGHQEKDQQHAKQHEGDHLVAILMGNSSIPKGLEGTRAR